jgi:hypothetical protein
MSASWLIVNGVKWQLFKDPFISVTKYIGIFVIYGPNFIDISDDT